MDIEFSKVMENMF